MSNSSICLFSSYFVEDQIPDHVLDYLIELKKHVKIVTLITNTKKIKESDLCILHENEIRIAFVNNKGYDFGMYYSFLTTQQKFDFDEIILANDSCVLINSLDPFFNWFRSTNSDIYGLLDSYEKEFHLQSYFLGFKKSGWYVFSDYLKKHKIIKKKKNVISTYEIGLSKHFRKKRLKIDSLYKTANYANSEFTGNPAMILIKSLITNQFPLIKLKILINSFDVNDKIHLEKQGFDTNPENYLDKILKANPNFKLPFSSSKSLNSIINP